MRFYLDNFERYYKRGLDAFQEGDMAEARFSLLKASEYLFKLARDSEGRLRDVRKRKAMQLLKKAKKIKPERAKKDFAKTSLTTNGMEGEAEKGEVKRWIVSQKIGIAFEDVAGLEDVKHLIRMRVIYPFLYPEVTARYKKKIGGGVLLYGPPGNGKTMIARAIASELDATFFSIRCSDIITKWVGEAEQNMRLLFDTARQYPRAVIFLDEAEALVSKRGGHSTVMNRLIPEFLSQADGLDTGGGCLLLLGATNRPWDIDEAALRHGRFGELIYVGLPNAAAREHILKLNLEGVPLAETFDLRKMAEELEGYTGADIAGLCQLASDKPYEREIAGRHHQKIEKTDFEDAKKSVRLSVTPQMLQKFKKFRSLTGDHIE